MRTMEDVEREHREYVRTKFDKWWEDFAQWATGIGLKELAFESFLAGYNHGYED